MNTQTKITPAFDAAVDAYESTLIEMLKASGGADGDVTDAEMDRRLKANSNALEALAKVPATTLRAIGEKLRILRALLMDGSGYDNDPGPEPLLEIEVPDDKRAADLLASICKDVSSIGAAPAPASVPPSRLNREALDRMTLRVPFVAAGLRMLRNAIEFGPDTFPDYLLDSVDAILLVADEAKDAQSQLHDERPTT